jgi:hypothetical protein
MSMKREVAETICNMLDNVLDHLQTLNNYVNENCDDTQIEKIRPAVAVCVAELDLEILDPIYRVFPDLKPQHLP